MQSKTVISIIHIAEKVVVPLSPKKHWTPSP